MWVQASMILLMGDPCGRRRRSLQNSFVNVTFDVSSGAMARSTYRRHVSLTLSTRADNVPLGWRRMTMNFRTAKMLCLVAALGLVQTHARAERYPNQTIKIVVPFAPGGGVDAIARLISEKLK